MAKTKEKKNSQAAAETAAAETAAAVNSEKVADKTVGKNVIRFPKRSFLRFERYAKVKDLLGAMLDDDKKYSIEEVDEMLIKEGGKK